MMTVQLFSVVILLYEMFDIGRSWHVRPINAEVVLTRFGCGIVLHIYLIPEFNSAYSNMKYALNHPWKFRNYRSAYYVGLSQLFVVMSVEAVNLLILQTNETIMDTIMNFLALVVIAEFDDYFFIPVAKQPYAKLISD